MTLILLLLIWNSLPVLAAEAHVESAFDACLAQDWQTRECEFYNLDDPKISQAVGQKSFFETAVEALMKTVMIAPLRIKGKLDCLGSRCKEAMSDFHSKLSDLKKKLQEQKLSKCRIACLVNCISSKMLIYRPYTKSKSSGLGTIVTSGEGECTEFSRLNEHIGESVGLPTSVIMSLSRTHVYVQQRIDGVWYFSEPQDNLCRFYYSKSKADVLLKGLGEIQGP